MTLELSSLKNVILALGAVIERSDDGALMRTLDPILQGAVKAGVIQHFELAYELCWKFMKRWIEVNVGSTVADGVTRRELFRQAAEQRLIQDVGGWMAHHHARNQTLHSHDSDVAEAVYVAAHAFVHDARCLLAALEERND